MGNACWDYSLDIYLGECFPLHCVYSSMQAKDDRHNIREPLETINVVMLKHIKSNMVCVRRQYVVPKNMNPQYIINVVISVDALGTRDQDQRDKKR